jgi:(p)ppGpp synthase/HD superfamily hydrolase
MRFDRINGDRFSRARARIETLSALARQTLAPGEARLVDEALAWMVEAHVDQDDRPGGAPYLEHPTSVTLRLLEWLGSIPVEAWVGALLHDAVEDAAPLLAARSLQTKGGSTHERAFAALEETFGRSARHIVARLTNPDFRQILDGRGPLPREILTEQKRRLYLDHVVTLARADGWAGTIKLSDLYDNALQLNELQEQEQRDYLFLKYGPVLDFYIAFLQKIPPDHPLYSCREARLEELRHARGK